METRLYFGCRLTQRSDSNTTPFFVFYARVKDIKQWAGVRRIAEIPEGTQRVLRPYRRRAICRFLEADSLNTIPNSILLAFEPGVAQFTPLEERLGESFAELEIDIHNGCDTRIEWGTIKFSFEHNQLDHLRPALVVDGQHRLYGMSDFDAEDIPMLVVSLVDADVQEQAFQFIVINNKAVRVPTDNVKSIIADIDEAALQSRLLEAGVKYGDISPILRDINDLQSSPFQNLLDWPYNRDGERLVPLTAIEQALRYLRTLLPFLEEDDDSLVGLFCAIWQAVRVNYEDLWRADNKFMKKVNLNALNEYIVERLKHAWEFGIVDIFDPETVEAQVADIVKLLPQEFWEADWSIKIQDNANVRRMIKQGLDRVAQNYRLKKRWYEDIELLEGIE